MSKVEYNEKGTIKDLPPFLRLENIMLMLGGVPVNPLANIAAIQWIYNSWQASKNGHFRMPVAFEVFVLLTGESCAHISDRLAAFGVPTQVLNLQFDLWPNRKGIGIRYTFLVPATMAGMADDILRQDQGSTYYVNHRAYGTGARYTRPWGVPAKSRSWEESLIRGMFHFVYGKGSMKLKTDKTKGDGKLQRLEPRQRKAPAKARQPRKQTTLTKVRKGIWNA